MGIWWDSASLRRGGEKGKASLSAYLIAGWFTHLICPAGCWPTPGALSALAEVSLVLQEGLWLQSYLEGHLGRAGGGISRRDSYEWPSERCRGVRGAFVPRQCSRMPRCAQAGGHPALNTWTGPRQARASPGCETSFRELHELLQ